MNDIQKRLDFFDSFLKNYQLSKDGVNLNIWCPFCKDDNKNKLKMVVHLEKCWFHCWVCDKKGVNVGYLVSRINKTAASKCQGLFKTYNKKFSLFDNDILEEKIEIFLPDKFKFFVESFDFIDPDVRDVFDYAKKRGISKHKLCMLRVGYSLSYEFRRYLILPSYDKDGILNFYTARNIDVDTHSSFKYKNANISKKNVIFNEINIDWSIPLTLVEGPLDLIKTNDNATCLLGSSLTEDMLLFQRIVNNRTMINLSLDSDVYYKSLKIAKLLSEYDIEVNILDTRGSTDVGDMSKENFNNILNNAKKFTEHDSLLAKIKAL